MARFLDRVFFMYLPNDVTFIISTLESAGYEAFAVGGCVRDMLRGVIPKDWDIATSATPQQAKALFSRTVDTGIKHGTIMVLLNKAHYEVTTYRIDGTYLDNRRPETVTFSGDIEEDLSRRDFTMNAIAYNPRSGFVDPFHGQSDIQKEIIRCVGNAQHRFAEDALRMLRAIRFAAATGFAVDEDIMSAISKLKQNLEHISPERIREELGKLLCAPYPHALELLESTGILPIILQNRAYGGNITEVVSHLKNCPINESMRLALFLSGTDCENILRDLRFDNKTINAVTQYVQLLPAPLPTNRYAIKKLLRILSQESFENLLQLKAVVTPSQANALESIRQEANDIRDKGECFTLKTLAINGNDLSQMGIPPGKVMGDILEGLLDAVMRDAALRSKAQQIAWVQETFIKD